MSPNVASLFQAALQLSDDEQSELAAALVAAVDERGPRPFDDNWLEEIRRRSDLHDAGESRTIPWQVVKERSRRRASFDG